MTKSADSVKFTEEILNGKLHFFVQSDFLFRPSNKEPLLHEERYDVSKV